MLVNSPLINSRPYLLGRWHRGEGPLDFHFHDEEVVKETKQKKKTLDFTWISMNLRWAYLIQFYYHMHFGGCSHVSIDLFINA